MTSLFRSLSRSIRFTISPAPPPPFITSTTRSRPPRPRSMGRLTCWAWPSGCGPRSFRLRPGSVRRPGSIHPQAEQYWGHVNPIGPRSCYDVGKRCAATLFFDYWRQHKLPIKVARIFNTYGPRMHPNDGRVVSNFIVQALLGRDITVFGDGLQTRSFCYVDDLIDGLVRLMNTGADLIGPINLGNPKEFTILELASLVIELTGSRSHIVHRPRPQDDPRQRRPDISKANDALSWTPTTELAEGLNRTIEYFEGLLSDGPCCDDC